MKDRKDYLERLKLLVEGINRCTVRYCTTVLIRDRFKGQTIEVEVFDLIGHPQATRAYGWQEADGERLVTMAELPPVESAETAVHFKRSKKKRPA